MKKLLCLLLAFSLLPILSKAQLGYTFTSVAGTYTAITGGTTIHAAGVDDVTTSGIPIGFTFNYNCSNFTTVSVSSNGWLSFNSTTTSAASNDLDANTIGNIVAPLWDDLAVYTGGTVSYRTTGSSPNRVFTVQWSVMEWNYSASADVISFQVKLYETSNRIEFIYSQGAGAINSGSASIGICGATGDYYSLDGAGNSPNASKTVETTSIAAKPGNGRTYRWDQVNCSGTPSYGTVTVSPTAVCSGTPVSLTATGATTGCGITYQWQSAPDNATWLNIPGATTATYTVSPTAPTYYRFVITCTNGGASATSASTYVTINAPLSCYCTSTSTSATSYFSAFSTTGGSTNITNNSGGYSTNGYGDFTAMTVTQSRGEVVNFNTTLVGTTVGVAIWADWNQDGDFNDANETAFNTAGYVSTCTGSFTVPMTATLGSTRLRIRMDYNDTDPSACGSITRGETEDYTIVVTAAQPMVYVSSAVTQTVFTYVVPGETDREIIGLQVVTNHAGTPLNLSSITFTTTGTTAPLADIQNARVWYTGTSSTFATTAQYGADYVAPNGTFVVNGSQVLANGTNYFWLTYDIQATATTGNEVDARVTSIALGSAYTPSPSTVTGTRPIQNITTIGTGTSTQNYPFNAFNGYTRSASLFTSPEIGVAGTITHLAWNVSTAANTNIPIKIYIKQTNAAVLTATTWDQMILGATLVYNATERFNATGWYTIDITDYPYCTGNIIILCEANYGGTGAGTYPSFYYTSMGASMHEYYSQSTTPPTTNGTLSTSRPNIQITKIPPTACGGTPSAGTVSVTPSTVGSCNSLITLMSTGYSTTCGLTYQWQWSPDNIAWTDIPGATTIPYSTSASGAMNYYRLKVTCANSGLSVTSSAVTVTATWAPMAYSFAASTSVYGSIGGTTIHAASVDDATVSGIPIGFPFQYGCQSYTTVSVSTNGWMSFNSTTSTATTNDLAGSTIGNIVAPLWDDLATSSSGSVTYQTTGTTPNRIFIVQWKAMEWNFGATGDVISFQVRLNESGNQIRFYYSQGAVAVNSGTASIGLTGGAAGDFYSLSGSGASPTVSNTVETSNISTKPATNQLYTWAPQNCSGTPSTPTITASATSNVCALSPVILSATGYSRGCGLNFQWQYSPDNVTWTNVTTCSFSIPATVYPPSSPSYYRLSSTCSGITRYSNVVTINIVGAPANDEPCNAQVLPVGTSCSFTSGSNNCATASEIIQPGIPAPGCGTYSGGDVWFKVTVPASGRLIVDMDENGGPTDMDMAWYTGTSCSSLTTLIECDAYDSQNGSMAMICRTGTLCTVPGDCAQNGTLTPGSTVWIRVWENGNDTYGNFDICAYDPGASAGTSNCANATTITSLPYTANGYSTCCRVDDYDATVGCASAYQDGEDYLFAYTPATNLVVDITLTGTSTYTGVFITAGCPDVGACLTSATSSTGNPSLCSVNLTAGTTYYIMVDTDPTPNCTNFNLNIREANVLTCGLNYTPFAMTYAPDPYAGTVISLPIDDRFSSTYIPIGFPFCFDGIQYTQLLVSSNSYVIFDPLGCATNLPSSNAAPGASSAWSISGAVPNTTNAPRNCIMFPFHDTYPSTGGTLEYQVLGTSPNRRFVLTFDNVPMFSSSCSAYHFTGQLKLFETSNNIEVHLENKDMCSAWNTGQAILGLHNFNGTIAVVPAGYNAPTQWTAYNRAWRFICNCTGCIALPVEYLSFTGSVVSPGINKLEWKTATEINNDYFDVERMTANNQFEAIGKVDGAGNSNEVLNYSYLDEDAPIGVAYYRLKQVDLDGKVHYSSTIAVGETPEMAEFASVYPNPANENLTVECSSDGTEFRLVLLNVLGQEFVLDENVVFTGQRTFTYSVYEIPAGTYYLKAENQKNEIIFKDKIVIQR